MNKRIFLAGLALLATAGAVGWTQNIPLPAEMVGRGSGQNASSPGKTPASETSAVKLQAMISATQEALVVVEYTFQFDKGDPPGNYEDVVRQERPFEESGVLVDATHIVTNDLQIHPRFIKGIKVRRYTPDGKSDQRVIATLSSYPTNQDAIVLELSETLAGAKPAAFDVQRPGPYSLVDLDQSEGRWGVRVSSFGGDIFSAAGKLTFSARHGLVVDGDGLAVGISTGVEMPVGAWKMPPLQWPAMSGTDMAKLLSTVESQSTRGIVSVTLNFRSPKTANRPENFGSDREADAAIQHVLGVVTDDHTILVLSPLKPSATARLERIRVQSDPPMDATFKASLTDYGAFVAEIAKPIPGGPALSKADITGLRDAILPSADISLHGEQRIAYFQPRRIGGFNVGWRGNLYPELSYHDKETFFFDQEGKLLALPVQQREKASTAERYSSSEPKVTAVAQLARVLGALKDNTDPNNIPLSEEQENRLAWVGVELQALTPELARANNVSDQTKDGESGGLVTYVYAGSPAEKAGVEQGWVLLRIEVPGEPKPIDVHVESDRFGDEPFPWDRLGTAPEAVFDRIPTPWSSVETPLVRTLTDLGMGRKFTAEFAHGGKVEKKEFTVIQGPLSYDSAPKYKHAGLGITVRNLTYEVRRYLQKKEEDPGVVIGKIEMGSKASVAGLKPYEVITHVNDQPVMNVKDFERLSKDQTELRLSVKRMTAGRIVKITIPAVDATQASQPN